MAEEKKVKSPTLRRQTETALRGQPVDLKELTLEETQTLIHELQVHQIELEMQNEELRQAQQGLAKSRHRYTDLYDFAPVGNFTISEQGLILQVNLAGASLVGAERRTLLNQPFSHMVARESQDRYDLHRRQLIKTKTRRTCELDLVKKDGSSFFAQLESIFVEKRTDEAGYFHMAVMDISEHKATELALQESEQRHRQLLEAVTDYIYSVQIKSGQPVAAEHSPSCEAVTGYTSAEYKANPNLWYEMIYDVDRDDVTARIDRVLAGGEVPPFEHRIIHKNGELRWLRNTWVPCYDKAGKLIAYEGLISDVTARKQAEELLAEERNLLRTLIDNLPHYVYVKDAGSRFITANQALANVIGDHSVEKLLGKTDFELFPQDLAEVFYADEQMIIRSGQPLINKEEFGLDAAGNRRWVLTTKVPLFDNQGQVSRVIGIGRDITELKQIQEAYQMLVEHSLQGLAILQGLRVVFTNPALAEITGYTADEIKSFSSDEVQTLVHLEDRSQVWQRAQDRLAGKPAEARFEFRFIRKDGQVRWLETFANPIEYQGEAAVQVAVIDITARKQAEEALRENEARYRTLFYDSPVALWDEDFSEVKIEFERLRTAGITDFKAYFDNHPQTVRELVSKIKVIDVNESTMTLYDAQDKRSLLDSLNAREPEEIPQFAHELAMLASGETFFENASLTRTQLGKPLEIIVRWSVPPGYEETLSKVFVSVIDITERKRAEAALYESEQRFRTLFETAAVGIVITGGRNDKLVACNPAFQMMLGYSERELRRMTILDLTVQDDHEKSYAAFEELQSGKRDHVLKEIRYRHKDGRDVWGFASVVALRDSKGDWLRNYAVVQDITQRKITEEELVYQANLLHNVSEAIIATDVEFRITAWNKAAEKIYGWQEDEVIGQNIDAICETVFLNETQEEAQKRLIDQGQWLGELRQKRRNGEPVYVRASVSLLTDGHGNPIGGVTVNRDMTNRKQLEEALKTHGRVLDSMAEGVIVADEANIIYFTNPAFDAMFGYEAGELSGQHASILNLDPAHTAALFTTEIIPVLQSAGVWFGEFNNRKKDGSPFITAVRISWLEMPDRTFLVNVQEDITERKRMDLEKAQLYEEASEQREQLRALAGRLVETQEAERKAIARELHDQMGQNLTALDLNLNILQGQISKVSPQVSASIQTYLDDSLALVEHMGARIRDIMVELRPSVLDDYGLPAALHWYASQLALRTDFTIEIRADEPLPRLPASAELALFRIVQEALTNVARHAQASQVTVSLDSANGTVRLVIADDGLGFAVEDDNSLPDRQSWGLITMAERAEAVGAQCRIESRPGQGTQVTVEVLYSGRGEA